MYSHSNILSRSIAAVVIVFLYSGCDPSIDPIQENDLHYSIFGYLNASADTQFVRIEKLRDSLFTDAPAELNVEVKLTNISNGQTAILQDSVFQYLPGKAHNYYTTLEIIPTHTYRLEVNQGEAVSSVQVEIPDTFPEPDIVERTESISTLEIHEIERLIAVNAIYYTSLICQKGPALCPENPEVSRRSFEHLADTVHTGSGIIQARIDHSEDLRKIELGYAGRPFTLARTEVMVAAGTPAWPDFLRLDQETAALPGVASNVEGGTGLLGGIVTDTVVVNSNEE